jgi:uncharacterized membrane protein
MAKLFENLGAKEWFIALILILFLTDITILIDFTILRQILGFPFLTFLPGLLILHILKLNKIGYTEKFVLAVGLSISFLMLFGLLINNLSFSLGYETPLVMITLLISFNLSFIVLTIIGYKINKELIFTIPNLNLSASEKAFLIVPIMFPALSIFGMHVMNTTDNNLILMFLLFLIPAYVISVCFFNQKFPKRLCPVVIFLISISLLILLSLRSNHIIGVDAHLEYYFFQTTLNNLHWNVFGYSTLDACLSISLLPTIYQSLLNIPSEFLFKILYSLIYSISPLVIYVISKKYVGVFYAFLASCFFMFQLQFLWTALNARTNTAILFFALAMMVLFSDKIDPWKKRILFILFMASCIVSHYSTSYIFFFIMLGAFVGMEILSKKYTAKKVVSLTIVLLFFAFIFFWYSQVTEMAFNKGVSYIENTLTKLNMFFIVESRRDNVQTMFGANILQKGIPQKIEFVFTWLTFAFIGIGVITLIRRYKEMLFSELNFKKPDFLKEKFEVGYFVIALACSALLVAFIALPWISTGYGIDRLYAVAITILSVFFVIGGIIVAKYLNQIIVVVRGKVLTNLSFKKKALLKKQKGRQNLGKSVGEKNGLDVRAYFIILLILIPYFFCGAGVTYQAFGVPQSIILNSEGEYYDTWYVHDQETYGAMWLKEYNKDKTRIYTDFWGRYRLISQARFLPNLVDRDSLCDHGKINGYIYLSYYNVVNGKLWSRGRTSYNLTEYRDTFVGMNRIYNNGGTEVYK